MAEIEAIRIAVPLEQGLGSFQIIGRTRFPVGDLFLYVHAEQDTMTRALSQDRVLPAFAPTGHCEPLSRQSPVAEAAPKKRTLQGTK